MDWLTYEFCVLIWVLCVSKSQSQLLNSTSSLTVSDQSQSTCEEGQPVPPPDECNSCICFAGMEYCTNLPCPEQECIIGEEIPQPDECNKCICKRGKVVCTNMICIPAPNCAEEQMYRSQNKCNACMCRNGFIRCTSNVCTEENTSGIKTTTTSTETPKKKHNCTEGTRLPGRHKCVECFCVNGRKKCKNICIPPVKMENRFAETSGRECISGQHLPKPNECNNCICFEGEIHCTHTPCHTDMRIGPECSDDQPVFRPDECNECHCFEGRLHCSDLVCIRGSKCVEGQVIPKPDSCNACKCVEGHILCTNYQCPIPESRNGLISGTSTIEVKPAECQDGDVIPPLPPPYECNACFCIENSILCTMKSCVNSDLEIKGRLKEQNEQNDLEIFDKQISVKPFIEILYKNNDKIPTKLIHTHAYNGFHQEIKVHASHLPKDATSLLKALATSLDNSALASISQKLLTSPDSLSNNHVSKKPFDYHVVQNNLIGEGNVLTTQSSKLITSGSQSNETILVIPNPEPFESENPQSVLPLTNKHETIWKTVSAPAAMVYHNNPLIQSRNSQEEDLNVYHDDRPSIFSPDQQSDMIRNPSKFSRPGRPRILPTKPTSDTLELPNVNTQLYPILNPKPISNNDGKMNYAPFYQENNRFKPVPSSFGIKRDELPIFRPGQFITTPNNNGGQQKPSQFQFAPNPSMSYPNQAKPQEFQFKPDRNQPSQIILPTSSNKGYQHPLLFPNTPNQPLVSANQYKPSQFGLKRGQGNPLNNISNQTVHQLKQFPPNFQMIAPVINLPNQKKRISSFDSFESETSKYIPIHSEFGPNTGPNILNPSQYRVNPEHNEQKPTHSQFVPNPSIYYKHEYEGPTIDEVNPDKEQLLPYSKLSYTPTEHYNQPYSLSEPGDKANIPKVRNKTKKYNTTHSHYEKHTSITYVSEYDPDDPAHPNIVGLEPNQDHNAPHNNEYEHYLPDQESQELDLTRSKVNYYLNVPNLQIDQKEPHSILNHQSPTYFMPPITEMNKYHVTTDQFHKYPHSPGDGENTDQNKSNQNLTNTTIPVYPNNLNNYPHIPSGSESKPPQDNSQISSLNDPGTADGYQSPIDSVEYPTHQKSNEHLLPLSETGPTLNQHPPGAFDGRGSTPEFQYAHSANQDPRLLKSVHNLPSSKFETPQNQNSPEMLTERGFADSFQYPSYSAEDPTDPNQKQPNSPHSPTQNQHSPRIFDERGSADGFQYPSHFPEDIAHPKPNIQKQPNSPYSPLQNQHSPGIFDERGSADGFQYPAHFPEDIAHPKPSIQKQPNSPYSPLQNQHSPGIFDERGSADGFQYPSHFPEDIAHPKPSIQKQPNSPYSPLQNQHSPGIFDERGSADGFQYPSHFTEDTALPKQNIQKQTNSPNGPTQNQHSPGIFDERGSADGFQYPSHFPEDIAHPKPSIQKQPNSPYSPLHNQHSPGIFDERGSADGFQYPSHFTEDIAHPKPNIQKQPNSPYSPLQNQHSPGIFDDRGSADGFQYPSHFTEDTALPKQNIQKQTNSPNGPTQNQHSPGMFDVRGSADGFQYPSHSAEDPTHPKTKPDKSAQFDPDPSHYDPANPKDNLTIPPQSQFGPAQNKHEPPEMPGNRGVKDGYQYAHNANQNPAHLKPLYEIPEFSLGPTPNPQKPGTFDERGSVDGFKYPSNSARNPIHSRGNLHIIPQKPQLSPINQNQYPSNSAEHTSHPKGQIPSNSLFGPTQDQKLPGIIDDLGSAGGFGYPSNSAEKSIDPKDSLYNSPYSKENLQKPSLPQFGPTQNQYSPSFHYPSHSAEIPLHPNQKRPNSPYGPILNQHSPGIIDERGSPDDFKYPSHSAENPSHTNQNKLQKPNSSYSPTQNQHSPGIFDERGSPDGFQYPSHSAENPSHQKQPNSPYGPIQSKHLPGMFDERGSANGLQYPSHAAESPLQSKDNQDHPPQSQFLPSYNQYNGNINKQPNSPYGPTQNKYSAEDSTNPKGKLPQAPVSPSHDQQSPSFYYPSQSAEKPSNLNKKQPNSPFGPIQIKKIPGMIDERGSADGFQYPSHSAQIPLQTNDNRHHPSHAQFLPSHNQYKQPNSPYVPTQNKYSAEDSTNTNGQLPHSPVSPTQNQHSPSFYYPSHSAENPSHPNKKHPNSPYGSTQNQHSPGIFDDRGSTDGFQYPSQSAENLSHTKPPESPYGPTQSQHSLGILDERGSADGFQYPSYSAEDTEHTIDNLKNPSQSQFVPSHNQYKVNKQPNSAFGPAQGQYLPVLFDKQQSSSTEDPIYPKNNIQNVPHPQLDTAQIPQKDNIQKQPEFPFGPTQIHDLPVVFDESGSADGFQYPSYSADDPSNLKNNPNSKLGQIYNDKEENQPDPMSDLHATTPTSKNYNNNNPARPWMYLDHDQYKPSSFDNLLNGVHNIPWSLPEDHEKVSNIITSTSQPRFEPDHDQYKPSSFDNLHNAVHDIPSSLPENREKILNTITSAPKPRFKPEHDQYKPTSLDNLYNGIHQISWPIPYQDNDALGTDAEITTPRSTFKPNEDQYGLSKIENPSISISKQNDPADEHDNRLQTEQDILAQSTEPTNSDSAQFKPHPEIESGSDPDNVLPSEDGKIPDYYDQLYPLFNAVKKLSEPNFDDSALSVDQLDLLPFLFPGIAKILNYDPEKVHDDSLSIENHDFQRLSPLSKLKAKFKQLPESGNAILNWLKSKLTNPIKNNVTSVKNDIDMTKIFHLLTKLTAPIIKDNAEPQNIPFSSFNPEIIENIINDFQEDTLTTTPPPRTVATNSYDNRFKLVPTEPEESRPQTPLLKYPDVHIILHQPNNEGDLDLSPYMETDGVANLVTDMNSEELSGPLFSKTFNPRFRHRPKDQKDECGDGTYWISNCHGCTCYFGQPMCFKMHDCELRPFGEPMTCKPYSHFKMGCYACECNGDGVAECDAKECDPKSSGKSEVSETTVTPLPELNEFFNSKETDTILQYYNHYKKLPKHCSKQDLQAQYPTCERGTSWVSSCHMCECNKHGKHECNKIDDCKLDFDLYGKPGRCKPNTKFYPKTNSMPCVECSCNDEGSPYCPAADHKKK